MYYEYWGMTKSAFDNVPDPKMYFKMHRTAESAVAEILFAVEEGNECLAVLVGDVGLGKTTALRVVLDTLDMEKYRVAFITNPDVTFNQLVRDVIGQLKGEPCEIKQKDELLEEFNHLLFETVDAGKKILVFIDEGNALKTANLESLRLLTNMQEDDRNLFTIILAGQLKLGKMLEDPRRANLFQRIGVYCRLEKMESAEVVKYYVEHRMERAGTTRQVFTDGAYERIYEFSEGIPRLVNKICKLSLKAGETNELEVINDEVVAEIAGRFERIRDQVKRKKKKAAKAKAAEKKVPEKVEAPAEEVEEVKNLRDELAPEPAPEEAAPVVEAEEYAPVVQEEATPVEEEAVEERQGEAVIVGLTSEAREKGMQLSEHDRLRYAGQLAAQQLKQHPEIVKAAQDPLERWKELREEILVQLQ
jgi:general secretion pathway protein A